MCEKCGLVVHPKSGCPKRPSQLRIRDRKGRKYLKKIRRFVGVDTEAIDDKLVYLCASDSRGNMRDFDDFGTPERPLEWLCNLPKAHIVYVGFYFDYDVSMLLKHLPSHCLQRLRTTTRCYWAQFRIEHVPGKYFTLTNRENKRTFRLWDAGGFAQSSFATVIKQWQLGDEKDHAFIQQMKAERSTFAVSNIEEIKRYCAVECKLLAQYLERIVSLHTDVGLQLSSYCGAGSTATAMFRRYGYENRTPQIPNHIREVAEQSYHGGRSETSIIGPYIGTIYTYDINSAYPYACTQIPVGITWTETKRFVPGKPGFYFVRWKLRSTNVWGPFPLRKINGKNLPSLLYPNEGEGWYSSYEVNEAILVHGKAIEIVYGFVCTDTEKAFPWIQSTIDARMAYKKSGDERHFPLKLGLNSIYGKMAQTTGKQQYRNVVYASWITGYTRAMIYRAIAREKHNVLLVATDGIIATKPLPLSVGAACGQWEVQCYENAWIAQAGVYWIGDKIRTRGFEQKYISFEAVKNAWKRDKEHAEVKVPIRRFIGYRQACARNRPDLAGTWFSGERIMTLFPHRRQLWTKKGDTYYTLPAAINWQHVIETELPNDDENMIEQPDWILE